MLTRDQIRTIRVSAAKGQPESQFLLSQVCLQNKDLEGMIQDFSDIIEGKYDDKPEEFFYMKGSLK